MIDIKNTRGVNHEVQVKAFCDINVNDSFFDSFRKYYNPYYSEWIKKKRLDPVYVAYDKSNRIIGFLKLKIEDPGEDYSDITPTFNPMRRLKICSFKVASFNYGLSAALMDLAFTQAAFNNISEIYGTVPVICDYKYDLENFIYHCGFVKYGIKESHGLFEDVYVRHL